MSESYTIYDEIRDKLNDLSTFEFKEIGHNGKDAWISEINLFKKNITRIEENINYRMLQSLPIEALNLLIQKLDSLLKNCKNIERWEKHRCEALRSLKNTNDAINPGSTTITSMGKTLTEDELISRRNGQNKFIEGISNTLENTFYKINRTAEDIYYIYCILLDQTKSPIHAFLKHHMTTFFTPKIDEFHEKVNLTISSLENDLTQLNNRYDSVISRYDSLDKSLSHNIEEHLKVQNDITSINLKLNVIISETRAKTEHVLENILTEFKNIIDSEKENLDVEITKTKDAHSDFITLVQNAGIYDLTQNYNKKAKEERVEYQTYRKYTTWSIIAAILTTFIIFTYPIIETSITGVKVDLEYLPLFARLTISIMFFALAFYTSRQAGKHYECYQDNHRTYLQLAALEPFLHRMTEAEKLEVRKTLIPTYFNQGKEDKYTSKENDVDYPIIKTFFLDLADLIKKNKSGD